MAEDQQQPARKSEKVSGQAGNTPRRTDGERAKGEQGRKGGSGSPERHRDGRQSAVSRPSGSNRGRNQSSGGARRGGGFSARGSRDDRWSEGERRDRKPRRDGDGAREGGFRSQDGRRSDWGAQREGEQGNRTSKPRRDGGNTSRGNTSRGNWDDRQPNRGARREGDGPRREGGFRGRDDRQPNRGERREGEFQSRSKGDRRGGDRRDGEFRPRKEGDRPRREGGFQSRPQGDHRGGDRRDGDRSRREGGFTPRGGRDDRWSDRGARREVDRGDRTFKPRRAGDGPRRDAGFKPRRDGNRFDRAPRRDDDRSAKSRQARHRSGGQFRRRDEVEAPIQTSLTGSPMPIRMDTKLVSEVPRPWFPAKDEWPEVPRRLLMEIESTARESEVKEVAAAVMIGTEAFEQGDLDRALEFFAWAKSRASRSITIREGLGICYYVAGDFEQAQRELQTYARLSGRAEHNHIIADSSRATGNGDRVPDLIEQMVAAWQAQPGDIDLMNLIEGLIVLAGYWLEERNQPEQALAAMNTVALPEDADITESHLRLWHVQARAATAAGDPDLAQAALDEIKAVNPEWLVAMDKWIAGEDVEGLLQPWATEIPVPEESEPSPEEALPDGVDEDGDILPDTIPDHLQDTATAGSHGDPMDENDALEAGEEGEAEDDSWDPGDDWEDEDWDEEDPEPGIPVAEVTTDTPPATPIDDPSPLTQPSLFDEES